MPIHSKDTNLRHRGFTLLEFLLVIVIFGVVLSVLLPRALRASHEAKFSNVRQAASEIASYMTQWAEDQIMAKQEDSNVTLKDFFMEDISREEAGFQSKKLIFKYTGNPDFNGVEMLITPERMQRNPFNGASYFSTTNDDPEEVPSRQPGLLYFVSAVDPAYGKGNFRNFYLIFTGVSRGDFFRGPRPPVERQTEPPAQPPRPIPPGVNIQQPQTQAQPQVPRQESLGNWYGQQDHRDEDGIRRGIFVARVADAERERTQRRRSKDDR
jgi:prepilin-type N-terminal cleavage/methylation domain-containing protein